MTDLVVFGTTDDGREVMIDRDRKVLFIPDPDNEGGFYEIPFRENGEIKFMKVGEEPHGTIFITPKIVHYMDESNRIKGES